MATEHNTTSRRAFVAGLAAAPVAAAATALAAGPDPIPALIEAHRAAYEEMLDAQEARRVLEEPRLNYAELAAQGRDASALWFECLETVPGFAEAVDACAAAMKAEEQAFRGLLAAAANHPSGFKQLALYACELTEERDGPAIGDALPAYRILAAFVGLPCGAEGEELVTA